ncbi:MAG: helix-turn-helix domain-containing protein [Gemmatimonadota bacterium]
MARLAIFQPDARSGARLTAALSGVHDLLPCESWDQLISEISASGVEGALIDADHPSPDEALARVALLRSAFADLAVVGFTERTRVRDFYELGEVGLDGFVSGTDGMLATKGAVDDALAVRRGRAVEDALRPWLQPPAPEAVGWSLAHAGDNATVEEMAHALGFSLYALRGMLHERGLPGPADLMVWGRLLAVAGRLHADGRKVEETAFALGYSSSPALARAVRSRTGLTPRELAGTDFHAVLQLLVRELNGSDAPADFREDIIPVADTSRRPPSP